MGRVTKESDQIWSCGVGVGEALPEIEVLELHAEGCEGVT